MGAPARLILFLVFAATGFSALTLQVVWQRVLSLHAGIDLMAATTVVTAFMAGLGLGSLLGGAAADRLSARGALLLFAIANGAIGAFAWSSVWLFYDVYRRFAAQLDSTGAMFGFHFLLLVVPTTMMGLSLPLLARGAVTVSREIAPFVGRLYAVNTFGAAAGALVAGWWLIGTFGFVTTVRAAGMLNFAAAVVVLLLLTRLARPSGSPEREVPPAPALPDAAAGAGAGRAWPWFMIYGLTGAVAIGLEVVYLRVIDAVLRNNSYTFATALAMYLSLFGLGAVLGSWRVSRVRRPDLWFLALQFGVGATALLGMLVFLHPPSAFGIEAFIVQYFNGPGFMHGGYTVRSAEEAARLLYSHVIAPLLIMGTPVLLMGASFPFIQTLVAQRIDSLGRRTGMLLFSNICGNVLGGAVTGFVLLDWLGTAGTLQLLAGVLVLPGLAAAARLRTPKLRYVGVMTVIGLIIGCIAVFPSNERFWAFFHGVSLDRFELEEDRACVTALVKHPADTYLYINANWQNGEPYDPFHILIGLLPSLMHDRPVRGLAIGLGIGSTAYSMAQDSRIQQVDCVEICGGQKRLIRTLAGRGSKTSQRLLADPTIRLFDADGRRWLLSHDEPYDIIVVDAVRPDSAYAGNLYSVEFYELVASRLAPGGLFVQWVPTDRVSNSVRRVFPHVAVGHVPEYYSSRFLVASKSPIRTDGAILRQRLSRVDLDAAFHPDQALKLVKFFEGNPLEPLPFDGALPSLPDVRFNRDLHPRDEYFLNKPR